MTYKTLFCWVPNALTGARFVLGLLLPWSPERWQFGILLIAGLTDLVDGWIARRLQLTPRYGQLADPIADKVLILAAVYTVMREGWVSWWQLIAIVSRDVVALILSVVALTFALENWRRLTPRVLGKLATATQIVALATLFWFRQPNDIVVLLAGAVSVVSACDYIGQAHRAARQPPSAEQAH